MGQEFPPDLPAEGRGALIRLVTRLLVAQAAAAGAIGLFFIHPAVARAYGSGPRPAGTGLGESGLGEPGLGEPGPADGELGQA